MKALGLLALLWLACGAAPEPAAPDGPVGTRVSVGMHVIEAELADSPERKARGLSGRSHLAPGHGMLFVYPRPGLYGFWMPDMHFDIDIVWIREDRVVDIRHRVPHDPPGTLPTYRPAEPADQVLEVPAGTAERLGWQVGDPVRIEPPPAGF